MIDSSAGPATLTMTVGGPAPVVLLDYGREVGGVPQFDVIAATGAPVLHAAYSESATYATAAGDGASMFPHSGVDPRRVDDYLVTGAGPIDNRLVQGGQRYQYLTLTTPGSITLRNTNIRFTAYRATPEQYQGWFLSSDDQLNKIWYSGAYTAQLGMVPTDAPDGGPQPVILDGGKRDRMVWIGDLLQTIPTILDSLGTNGQPYVKGSLAAFSAGQYPLVGMIPGFGAPNGPLLPYSASYSIYYVLDLAAYYLRSGDTAFVRDQYSAVARELAFNRAMINPATGLLVVPPLLGADWDVYDLVKTGAVTEVNTLYFKALLDGADLADAAGHADDASAYRTQAAQLREAINAQLFNPATGAYDISDTTRGPIAQDANAIAVLFGVAPPDHASTALAALRTTLWTPHGTSPFSPDARFDARISPFIGGYEVQARLAAGDTDAALTLMRTEWGQMVAPGPQYTGTNWESLNPDGTVADGTISLAHGWSTGPTPALTEYVLGIAPASPGYQTWTLTPHPGDLTWARGQVPTPHGPITVSWTRDGDQLTIAVTAPDDTTGTIRIPGTTRDLNNVHTGTYTIAC
ncbi:alpha-L-rhamnosidase C-terminal domain-containing protein [Nocardia sp.]|uniref:alpha-L-rhamnosidase C-terminal domain-containing protein n=1 Tax=Nocardia sp. TaxID=1821 RepID=UPI00261F2B60|nr:alpha-L-rhamnosidase C-terminal domain-containing protein [Nocardia sp.]